MLVKVAVYLPTYDKKHCEILRAFAAGIPGSIVKNAINFKPGEADIGVVFGWYKLAYEMAMSKKPIIDYYLSRGPDHLIVVESGFQRRGFYYQIGWNGFAGFADFKYGGETMHRWNGMEIQVMPWRADERGQCVVIGQLPRDTQVQDVDHIGWCRSTVKRCQEIYPDVIFRPHPKVLNVSDYGIDKGLIVDEKLRFTLAKARCVVTWNSTTGVDAVLAGIPVVTMNRGAMAWPMGSHSLDEPLKKPERKMWLASLGYSQWTTDEMTQGLPWRHLTR